MKELLGILRFLWITGGSAKFESVKLYTSLKKMAPGVIITIKTTLSYFLMGFLQNLK